MDLFIMFVGGLILGYILGGKVMKFKILTKLAIMKMEYEQERDRHGV